MKIFAHSTIFFIAMGGAAVAADLPAAKYNAPVAPVPTLASVYDWSGAYAGVHMGYGWHNGSGGVQVRDGKSTVRRSSHNNGIDIGGQIGYNFQVNSLVLGVEADLGPRRIVDGFKGTGADGLKVRDSNRFGALGTVRGRVGVAFDRTLIYATGGLAYQTGTQRSLETLSDGRSFVKRRSAANTGWVLGGGVEYAFTQNLTGRIEGLYIGGMQGRSRNYADQTAATQTAVAQTAAAQTAIPAVVGPGLARKNKSAGEFIMRVGLNYKF